MVIFNSYVSLPEGIPSGHQTISELENHNFASAGVIMMFIIEPSMGHFPVKSPEGKDTKSLAECDQRPCHRPCRNNQPVSYQSVYTTYSIFPFIAKNGAMNVSSMAMV